MGANVMMAGAAMSLGGVIQMLSPQPGGLARKESPDNKASYAFGGVTNTASQGYPLVCFMVSGELAARLFPPVSMSKTSNK
jgi:predicted phage tail protein